MTRTRRHRFTFGAVLVTLLTAATVAALAWETAPSGSQLPRRVQQQLRATDARTVPLTGVAPILVSALIATEDERFYRHHGIDLLGLMRAVPYDVVHASFAQGASTLTEQVAKQLYLNGDDHSPWRKLEDMALAVKLENRYSKAAILDAYLNTTYFGAGAYGIGAASRRYFGITPRKLTLAQASLLAGLPQAPSAYDPLLHPAAARQRQVAVLRSLVRVGDVPATVAGDALAAPLRLKGGTVLPPETASVEPGPPLAWRDAAIGALLLVLGLALLRLRRQVRGERVVFPATGVAAAIVLLLGVAVAFRSFRSL